MNGHIYTGRSKTPPNPYEGEPSITTFAGLKKDAYTATLQYFAPVVAIYNVVAATSGLPTIKWLEQFEAKQAERLGKK